MLWDSTVERSRARLNAALADGGPDQLVHLSWPDGRHASLRRLLCDQQLNVVPANGRRIR